MFTSWSVTVSFCSLVLSRQCTVAFQSFFIENSCLLRLSVHKYHFTAKINTSHVFCFFLMTFTAVSYMEWWYVFPSYHKGGRASVIFFLGQVLYYMAVLHLEKGTEAGLTLVTAWLQFSLCYFFPPDLHNHLRDQHKKKHTSPWCKTFQHGAPANSINNRNTSQAFSSTCYIKSKSEDEKRGGKCFLMKQQWSLCCIYSLHYDVLSVSLQIECVPKWWEYFLPEKVNLNALLFI